MGHNLYASGAARCGVTPNTVANAQDPSVTPFPTGAVCAEATDHGDQLLTRRHQFEKDN